ncbi:MAG: cytochrome c-type biogenesis CcmF C-terminal domain-containing protein, partial [Gammaproteobacteria bacterium]
LLKKLRVGLMIAIASTVMFLVFTGEPRRLLASIAIGIAVWVMFSSLQTLGSRMMHMSAGKRSLATIPRGFYGMTLAHIGIGVFIIGVTLVSSFNVEKDLRMELGDQVNIGGYVFSFHGAKAHTGPNYQARRGIVEVFRDQRHVVTLRPEKRTYRAQSNPMTEAAIDAGLFRDLYVSLGEPLDNGAWSVRIYYKPFIRWIWMGPLLMAFGGLLAATDRRYRVAIRGKVSTAAGQVAIPATS